MFSRNKAAIEPSSTGGSVADFLFARSRAKLAGEMTSIMTLGVIRRIP
jgi:hypothetical protein